MTEGPGRVADANRRREPTRSSLHLHPLLFDAKGDRYQESWIAVGLFDPEVGIRKFKRVACLLPDLLIVRSVLVEQAIPLILLKVAIDE